MSQRCLVLFSSIILFTGLGATDFLLDYQYVKNFGWLRLHMIPATWADARLRCNMEGGNLASPTTIDIIKLIKSTMSRHGLDDRSVFVDIHSTKPKGNFTSLDGKPLNVPLDWANEEPNNLGNDEDCLVMTSSGKMADVSCMSVNPYICVKNNEVPMRRCDTTDKGYTLDLRAESCYKFHNDFVPWRRAYMVCVTEYAQLAVINSDKEAQVLKELFAKYHNKANAVHIGFIDWDQDRNFLTIFGQTLLQAGYSKWAEDEPSNTPGQYCGGMLRNGDLDNVGCIYDKLPFICETSLKLT